MGRGFCGLSGLWVVALVGGCLVSGVVSDGGRAFNATSVTDVNDGAINLLMESSASRVFTEGECVESVKNAKRRLEAFGLDFPFLFPPENFEPPGARKWCQCLANDPSGIVNIPNPQFASRDAPVQEFEGAFDRCRASVLEGRDYNTEDICRAMVSLIGGSMADRYVTFCGRICRSLENEYYYQPNKYELDPPLNDGCGRACAAEAMPGYCGRDKVWYTAWTTGNISNYHSRLIGIGDTSIGQGSGLSGIVSVREDVQKLCDALNPLLGSNPNECCNYPRGFESFKLCCALDSDGKSVFDCDRNFGDDVSSLNRVCRENERIPYAGYVYNAGTYVCGNLLRGHSGYLDASLLRDMKVFRRPSTGHFLFEFDDSIIDSFCERARENSFFGGGRCCPLLKYANIAANCVEDSLLEYVGRTTRPLDVPTPPAEGSANSDDSDDPCFGLCKDGRECVLAGNGGAFCVDCTALLKPKRSGQLTECCKYDADTKKCVTALKNSAPGVCKRTQKIFTRSDDGSTERASFRTKSGFACINPREFRDNGAACKIVVNRAGVPKCFE